MADWRITCRRSARLTAMRIVAATAAAAVAAASLATTASAQDRYTDVSSSSNSSHKANIEALEEQGVFDGTECGARRFCPNEPAKRWTVAVWIVRVVDGKDPFPVERSRFADVDNDEWWMPYVERLADLGVTVGCRQNPLRYCPDGTVSRGQMASFLVRAFRLQRADSAGFTDTRGTTHQASIDSLFAAGLTVGCRQNPLRYCPRNAVPRAQMATLLNRGLDEATSVGTGGDTGGTTDGGTTGGGTTGGGTTGGGTPTGTITNSQGARSGDTQIAATRGRTCAIRGDETVTCWGGDEGYREHLSAAGLDDVVAISTSQHPSDALHSCAVHGNGDISCWGAGSDGQLGQGDTNTYHLPVLVSASRNAVAVAAGSSFTCAVYNNGDVSCWGSNEQGQLGNGSTLSDIHEPRHVPRLFDVVAITAGQNHSCAIARNGDLSCWGWVYGTSVTTVNAPDEVTSVAIGGIETCITVADGRAFCWDYGETRAERMTQVANIRDAVKVSVGNDSACVLHLGGGVSCWGNNNVGQVGDGTTTRRSAPVRLRSITDAEDISVSSESSKLGTHVCVLHQNGSVSCWGSNEVGQLEDGTSNNGLTPSRVSLPNSIDPVDVPRDETDLLVEWVDTVVEDRERDFPWLADAWDVIRDDTTADESGSGGAVTVDCVGGASLGCDVSAMTITDMSLETVIRQLARVYDLETGLAPPVEWGAVQLYFATTYPRCSSGTDMHGSEALADTMLHVTLPHAWLDYSQGRTCRRLPSTPTRTAERVVEEGFDGDLPDWYTDNIVDGHDLWTTWLLGPSLPTLANVARDFGRLCDTNWITSPLDPQQFPPAGRNPFGDSGC